MQGEIAFPRVLFVLGAYGCAHPLGCPWEGPSSDPPPLPSETLRVSGRATLSPSARPPAPLPERAPARVLYEPPESFGTRPPPLPMDAAEAPATDCRGPLSVPQVILAHRDLSKVKSRFGHIAPTLLTCEPHGIAVKGQPLRHLSSLKCERLMGFPDGYTDIPYNPKRKQTRAGVAGLEATQTCGVSDKPHPAPKTVRYKALGNAWAINCARRVLRRLDRELPPHCPPATVQQKLSPPDYRRGILSQKHFNSSQTRLQNTPPKTRKRDAVAPFAKGHLCFALTVSPRWPPPWPKCPHGDRWPPGPPPSWPSRRPPPPQCPWPRPTVAAFPEGEASAWVVPPAP